MGGSYGINALNVPLTFTSLKGSLRSSEMQAYLLGAAAPKHAPPKVRTNQGQLDIVAKSFGYLDGGNVFAGLIHFSDAELGAPTLGPGTKLPLASRSRPTMRSIQIKQNKNCAAFRLFKRNAYKLL